MKTPTPLTDDQRDLIILNSPTLGDICRNVEAAVNQKWLDMLAGEPVSHQYQSHEDGTWHHFASQKHYENAVASGWWNIRSLYAHPPVQPVRCVCGEPTTSGVHRSDGPCYNYPPVQPVQPVQDKDAEIAKLRESICEAIKAEDDYCVTHGDYMLDSDDCIAVVRGTWKRPDFAIDAARSKQ